MNMKKRIVLAISLSLVCCGIANAISINCDLEYTLDSEGGIWGYVNYVGTAAAPDTGTFWNHLIAQENDFTWENLVCSDGSTVTPIKLEVLAPYSEPLLTALGAIHGVTAHAEDVTFDLGRSLSTTAHHHHH